MWINKTWINKTGINKTWINKTWIDKTWINKTWTDKTWINKTWTDITWINKTWTDITWINKTWIDETLMIFVPCFSRLGFYLFADDTNLLQSHKNLKTLEKIVNDELAKVYNWLTSNKLSLNLKKSNFVIFRPYQRNSSLHLNCIYTILVPPRLATAICGARTLVKIFFRKFIIKS